MASPTSTAPIQQVHSADYRRLVSASNFQFAWQRLMASSEPGYKWFWRPSAVVANTVQIFVAKRIRAEIQEDRFRADHVHVISQPKPTGLMRHKSILSIGDMLTYQAIANVVSPKLHSLISHRYNNTIFGNQLAAPNSVFFFQKWQEGYAAYNDAQRNAHAAGQFWMAHFDFASYYDSIDHGVLEKLLIEEVRVGSDVAAFLTTLLARWSSTGRPVSKKVERLYLGHGIPQGPQASAMLAEIPFLAIDPHMERLPSVTYLRYADDIRIFGRDEADVRYAATVLDRLARNLGIFPSAGKCGFVYVTDIEVVLKTVSLPTEVEEPADDDFALLKPELKDQRPAKVLWGLMREIIETRETERLTLFKRLLSTSIANKPVAKRLIEILKVRPDLVEVVCSYLERLQQFDDKIQDDCLALLNAFPGYAFFNGRILRLFDTQLQQGQTLCRKRRGVLCRYLRAASKRRGVSTDCQLEVISRLLAVQLGAMKPATVRRWLMADKAPSWSITHFILSVDEAKYGRPNLVYDLQYLIDHASKEVARAAAYRLVQMGVMRPNVPTIDPEAAAIFRVFRLDKPSNSTASRVGILLCELLRRDQIMGSATPKINWRVLLGDRESDFEKYAIRFLGDFGANKNGFILDLDAALEILINRLISMGSYTFPNKNGVMIAVTERGQAMRKSQDFGQKFPAVQRLCAAANDLRNRCDRAHSMHTATGPARRNRSVYHDDVLRALRLMPAALQELSLQFPV